MRDEAKVPRWGLYTMKYTYISQKQRGVGIQSMGGRPKNTARLARQSKKRILSNRNAGIPGETEEEAEKPTLSRQV